MPLTTETIAFDDERERLRDELEDVAEEQVEWEAQALDGNEIAQQHVQEATFRANQIQSAIEILEWADAEWDVEQITLSGLTAGEINRASDVVDEVTGLRERDAWVALGTREAPYVEHDPDDIADDEYRDTIGNVVDLPLPFVRWAESRISEMSYLGADEGNEYSELLQEKRAETQ